MDRSQIKALFDQDQRKDIDYPGMRREVTPKVVRHIDTAEIREGVVIFSELNDINVDGTIREQIRFFDSIGQDFEWKVYDYDQPTDLKERLATHGFEVGEAEAIMVRDLESGPEDFWSPIHHNVQRIIDLEKLADVQSIEEQVWGEDSSWLIHYLEGALRDYPNQMSIYLAYIDEQPASAAWIFFPENSQFASLWGGATIPEYRKQGLYAALLAVRAREARTRQVRYLSVDASPMSQPILERFGFKQIAVSYPCKWKVRYSNST